MRLVRPTLDRRALISALTLLPAELRISISDSTRYLNSQHYVSTRIKSQNALERYERWHRLVFKVSFDINRMPILSYPVFLIVLKSTLNTPQINGGSLYVCYLIARIIHLAGININLDKSVVSETHPGKPGGLLLTYGKNMENEIK